MTHPTSLVLVEYLKGELDAQRHQEIQQHLDGCDACKIEVEQLQAMALSLAEWQGPQLSEETVNSIKEAGFKALQSNQTQTRSFKHTLRKALTTAAIVLLTFLFQSLVWNPIKPVIEYNTTLKLLPSMLSIPSADASVGTSLYITVYPNQLVSTPYIEGQYGIEELASRLIEMNLGNQFETALIMGSNPEQPIKFETDALDDLQKDLNIGSIEIGPGLLELEIHDRFVGRILFGAGKPSFPDIPAFGEQPHSITIGSTVHPLTPGVRMLSADGSDVRTLSNLQYPQHLIVGFINESTVAINHAIFSLDGIAANLDLLHDRNTEISLTIIVPESIRMQDTGFQLANAARNAGIDRVLIKRIMPPQ